MDPTEFCVGIESRPDVGDTETLCAGVGGPDVGGTKTLEGEWLFCDGVDCILTSTISPMVRTGCISTSTISVVVCTGCISMSTIALGVCLLDRDLNRLGTGTSSSSSSSTTIGRDLDLP